MMSFVEVVCQIKRETTSKIPLNTQIRLFGICVYEILALRITEWLKSERKSCSEVVLVDEQRIGKIKRLKLLLVGQITQRSVQSRRGGRSALRRERIHQQPLKNRNRIQIPRVARDGTCRRAAKRQLNALRTIGSIAQKIQPEERMVVEQSVRSAHHRFAVTLWVPSDTNSRLDVIGIRLNAFLKAQEVISGERQSIRGGKLRRKLDVVTYAVVQRQVLTNSPGILPERPQRLIAKRVARASDALNEVGR